MHDADDFLSADEVYRRVYERLPGIGIATVYRTLQLLAELGALARITAEDGKARYRFTDEGAVAHRIVLVCTRCGRTEAIPSTTGRVGEQLRSLTESVATERQFAVDQSVHQYYGVCGSCETVDHV
jgi:Fur family ferric uptake transcriptional regulator